MTTQTAPNKETQHQFENRYSIYCHDPFSYEAVSNELIEQLAKDLGAINPVIVITVMLSGRDGKYLTADSFDTIQHLINEKESDEDYLAEGYGAYLLDINSSLFYNGYPKLFWKDYKFDDRVSSGDEWGEVSFHNPTQFKTPTPNTLVIEDGCDEFEEKIYDCGEDYLVEINNFPGWSYN